MSERFSKATLARYVIKRANYIYAEYRFDCGNGTAQVEHKSPKENRAYAEWDTLRSIAKEFDLWDHYAADPARTEAKR